MIVPRILVSCTQGKIAANGVTQADTRLPSRIQTIIEARTVRFASLSIIAVFVRYVLVNEFQVSSSIHRQIIKYWRIDISTNTERRIFYRTEDNTQFCIITGTRNVLAFPSCSVSLLIGHIIFGINRIAAVMNIMNAQGEAQPYAVVETYANVEIIFAYVALLILAKEERTTIVGHLVSFLVFTHQRIIVGVYRIPNLIACIFTMFLIQFFSVSRLGRSPFGLRCSVEIIGSRKNLREIRALVIVETEVELYIRIAICSSPNETNLIETRNRFLSVEAKWSFIEIEFRISSRLSHNASRETCHALSEQANTGRVAGNGRNICAQGFHSSTHTYIACSTREGIFCKLSILISFLSQHWG